MRASEAIGFVEFEPKVATHADDAQHAEIDERDYHTAFELFIDNVVEYVLNVAEINLLLD